jgi:TolB-like protein/tetratricopeptide (TPR) repeat protein
MNPGNFFAELKRRNVYKVAVAYAVIAWLLLQAASILFPTFEAPAWVMKAFVVIIAAGFVVALVIAWAFEMTPEGMKRTEDVRPDEKIPQWSRRKFAALILVITICAAALLGYQVFRAKPTTPDTSETFAVPLKSIAVLPFENLSDDKSNAYFADGIQDEILTDLAKIGALKVVSRSSVMHYKSGVERNLVKIGQELGVAHLLEGSVQRANNRVRVNAQLIDARTDAHLWAQTYDRDLADVFAIQSEIAKAIAEQLKAKITGIEQNELASKPTSNPEAYDAYLRGLALYVRGFRSADLVDSTKSLEEAVRLDPSFAQAWALLARGEANLYFFGLDTTSERREAARHALATAEQLRPDLAETQLARAWYLFRIERDYEGAKRVCEALRPRWPNNSEVPTLISYVLGRQGRSTEAEAYLQEALKLDPRSVPLRKVMVLLAMYTRRFPEALKRCDRVLEIASGDSEAIALKAIAYQAMGDLDNADAVLAPVQPAVQGSPRLTAALVRQELLRRRYQKAAAIQSALAPAEMQVGRYGISVGDLQRLSGDTQGAVATYTQERGKLESTLKQQADNPDVMISLAELYAALGENTLAIEKAEQALALRPESQDVIIAGEYEEIRARIAARIGETDRAIEILRHLLTMPYGPPPITPALLRLDPIWDPLRNDPRFQKLANAKQIP